jgi:hypothetical protein
VADVVSCVGSAGQTCQLTETVTSTETLLGNKILAIAARHKAKKVRKTIVLGSQTITLGAGQSQKLVVSLNGTGRSLLSRFGKLPVTLTIKLTQNGQSSTVATRHLTIKAVKKKKKGKKK